MVLEPAWVLMLAPGCPHVLHQDAAALVDDVVALTAADLSILTVVAGGNATVPQPPPADASSAPGRRHEDGRLEDPEHARPVNIVDTNDLADTQAAMTRAFATAAPEGRPDPEGGELNRAPRSPPVLPQTGGHAVPLGARRTRPFSSL